MEGIAIGVILLMIIGFGLWLWSLIHCIVNKRLTDGTRILGIILILILGIIGSLIYLFLPRKSSRMMRRRVPPKTRGYSKGGRVTGSYRNHGSYRPSPNFK